MALLLDIPSVIILKCHIPPVYKHEHENIHHKILVSQKLINTIHVPSAQHSEASTLEGLRGVVAGPHVKRADCQPSVLDSRVTCVASAAACATCCEVWRGKPSERRA